MKRAVQITLSETERKVLERLKRGRQVSVRLAERAAIVSHAADGLEDQQIGALMGLSRQKAGRWRKRYAANGVKGIEKDAPRAGQHRQIDEKKRAMVVRKTLTETPADPVGLINVFRGAHAIAGALFIATAVAVGERVRETLAFARALPVGRCAIATSRIGAGLVTKTGIMLGIGEHEREVLELLDDVRAWSDCDIITIGQYLQPTRNHLPIDRWVHPDEFARLRDAALEKGFEVCESGPLVRSSYHAEEQAEKLSPERADVHGRMKKLISQARDRDSA
jgi:transposase